MSREPTETEQQCANALAEFLVSDSGTYGLAYRMWEPKEGTQITMDGTFDTMDFVRVVIRAMKLDRQDHPVLNVFHSASVRDWNTAIDVASPLIETKETLKCTEPKSPTA